MQIRLREPGLPCVSILALALFAAPASGQEIDAEPYENVVSVCYGGAETPEARMACIGEATRACSDSEPHGHTTLGMSTCAMIEGQAWDRLLNVEYGATMDWAGEIDLLEREDFPQFAHRQEALRAAQRAWIGFRDAECGREYAWWGSGSIRQIAAAHCVTRMTAERTIGLRAMREEP